ncbi:MAG: RNA 2',3'-cyclic phosphodiesterase [Nitrospiraceae bacterium]
MIRAFVAIELGASLRQNIGQLQSQIRESLGRAAPHVHLQWVRPESIHLTLKFLGNIEDGQVEPVNRALASAVEGWARFSVELKGLDVFPDIRAPRVLWLGFSEPMEPLIRLAGSVGEALNPLGFPPEGKPFRPHLTLARIKERSREVGKALAESRLPQHPFRPGTLDVHGVSLMKSELKPSGAVYTRLHHVSLSGA